jgi:hypothetical protein
MHLTACSDTRITAGCFGAGACCSARFERERRRIEHSREMRRSMTTLKFAGLLLLFALAPSIAEAKHHPRVAAPQAPPFVDVGLPAPPPHVGQPIYLPNPALDRAFVYAGREALMRQMR